MIKCEFKEGHTIITEGDKGESLYIIKEGVISCEKENVEIRKLHSKDYFGESSILFETRRSLSIKSLTRSICYNITKNVLIEALGNEFKQNLLIGICKESFLNSKIMKHLIFHDYFARMYPAFKLHFYSDGEVIVQKSVKVASRIIILIEGNILNV
jgi:cGMP-dependent protein kinase